MVRRESSYSLEKKFVGYGHYELIVSDESRVLRSLIIGNTELIDRLNSEFPKDREEATTEAIALVLHSDSQ